MGMSPTNGPDDLVPIRVQITKAQLEYLLREKHRFQDRSIAPVVRRALAAAMSDEAVFS